MSADPPGDEEADGEALALLLGAVEAGDRLTLTLDPSEGVEETRVVESVSDAEKTPLDRDEPTSGNVAVWVRDLDRDAADEPPFAAVRFRPHGREMPTIRLHGYLAEPEAAAGWEFLGTVERASAGEKRD